MTLHPKGLLLRAFAFIYVVDSHRMDKYRSAYNS